MTISRRLGHDTWVCLRPGRIASRLEFSLQELGLRSMGAEFFQNSNTDVFHDTKGQIWISNIDDEYAFKSHILSDPSWFRRMAEKRIEHFECLTKSLKRIQKKTTRLCSVESPSSTTLAKLLMELRQLCSIFFLYAYLGLFDEEIVFDFSIFLKRVMKPDQVALFLHSILKSNYARNAISFGSAINESKGLDVNVKAFVPVIEGYIQKTTKSKMDLETTNLFKKLKNPKLLSRFLAYRDIIPLIYQFGQENVFVGLPLTSTLSCLLSKTASVLIDKHEIANRDDLSQYNLVELCLKLIEK